MKNLKSITLAVILILSILFAITACADDGNLTVAVPEPTVTSTPPIESTPAPTPEPVELPHEHIWQDANFQQPQMCIECGETEGEPLTPRFVEYGFTISEHGVQVPYITISRNAPENNNIVDATVIVTDFSIYDTFGLIEIIDMGNDGIMVSGTYSDLSDLEGWRDGEFEQFISSLLEDGAILDPEFEWRVITFEVNFTGDVAYRHGFNYTHGFVDYYSIDLFSDAPMGAIAGEFSSFTVNFNGNDYECKRIHSRFGGWNGNTATIYLIYNFFVPVGYDGVVMAFANADYVSNDTLTLADLIDEDTVFFKVG